MDLFFDKRDKMEEFGEQPSGLPDMMPKNKTFGLAIMGLAIFGLLKLLKVIR